VDKEAGAPPEVLGAADYARSTLVLQTNFVDIPFTVKDRKNGLVAGLTWRDVRVYENGVRQHMAVFTSDPVPMAVALVIDQSMPYDAMNRVNAALGALTGAFAPYDEVAVFTYNNGPKMQVGYTAGQGAVLSAVLERAKSTGREPMYYNAGEALGGGININNGAEANITPLTSNAPGGPNRVQQVPREVHTLNDAILAAAVSLAKIPEPRRRIIYVISDGKEYGSTAKTKDVIRYLQENKIQVNATLTGDSSVSGVGWLDKYHLPLFARDNNLPPFTNATGGQIFAEFRTKGIEESFAKVTEQIRNQYTVGYYSREPFIDGKYRKIEVQVMKPGLQVIAKDGYFPTPEATRPRVPATAAAKAQVPSQ
jgi:VWFA-related protein